MSAISMPTKPLATILLPQPRKQGFTIIEIVLVLVVLGILAAVAIPKYFDLQEAARVKVCEHNRAVIASTIEKQETLARYAKDAHIFDYKSQSGAAESAQNILKSMYPTGQKESACPSGGSVSIKTSPAGNNKGFFFTVTCSIHAPGSMIVTRTDGSAFVEWFKSAFHDSMDLNPYKYKSLSELFVGSTGAELDSEAGNYKNTLTTIVAGAMANAGLDVSNVIWRISREQWKGCQTGKSCRGKIDILLADKTDANESNKDKQIDATKFTLTVIYDADGKATFETSETKTKAFLKLKNENTSKKYWVLKSV